MRVLIFNNAEKGIKEFTEPVESIVDNLGREWVTVEYADSIQKATNHYDAIILSASPFGNDIVDHNKPYYSWIPQEPKPILGICAGHHIIGRLFGSVLIRDQEREVGNCTVIIDKMDPLFDGVEKSFAVRQNHKDSISLPEDFVLLAHSEKCKVQVMKHRARPIYSTQFHAELSNSLLIENFLAIAEQRRDQQKE
jgi:GMP synthase (glutamine-hydrolysing)